MSKKRTAAGDGAPGGAVATERRAGRAVRAPSSHSHMDVRKSSPHPVADSGAAAGRLAIGRSYAGCVFRRSSGYVMAPGCAMAA
jgi:hypothetical protein